MENSNTLKIEKLIANIEDNAGALLSVLHEVNRELGHIPVEAIPIIAKGLSLSIADVYGAITFYKDFRLSPPARNTIKICQAESCQSRGAAAITDYACRRLGIRLGESTRDNAFTLEPVYCLGNCACSPSIMLNGKLLGRMNTEKLKKLIDSLEVKD